MAYIGRDPQYGAFEKQSLTADSSTTTFTLDYAVGSAASLLVSVAGVHQEPVTAYNLGTNGTQIVFSSAPASGDTVFVIFLGAALDIATVGSTRYFAGGGGGGTYQGGTKGPGGAGGGGASNYSPNNPSSPGIAGVSGGTNTGGGGGGMSQNGSGGAGGKGIVIIRYKYQN